MQERSENQGLFHHCLIYCFDRHPWKHFQRLLRVNKRRRWLESDGLFQGDACASPGGRGWERIWYSISERRASQVALVVKNPPASAGDTGDKGSIPGSETVPGERNGNPLQDSCLENPMDRGAWRAAVLGVAKSQT